MQGGKRKGDYDYNRSSFKQFQRKFKGFANFANCYTFDLTLVAQVPKVEKHKYFETYFTHSQTLLASKRKIITWNMEISYLMIKLNKI